MLFTSLAFFLFFTIYFLLQKAIPFRYQTLLIILGGSIFYGYWNSYYIALPFFLIFVGYAGGRWLSFNSKIFHKKHKLIATLVILLLPLLFFKCAHFIQSSPDWNLGLPLGISFITFTIIAYVVDVYRAEFPNENDLKLLAALVLFFPHSIAGPILRPRDLIPQFLRPQSFDREQAYWGFALFTLGFAKKLLLADQLAEFTNPVFASGGASFTPFRQLLAVYAFAVQIYADFSGYTDMALGLALLLGYRLPINFSRPYLSTSLIDFWRRWHITFSSWLRDYIYIPLGGNRHGLWRQCVAIMGTMLIGGLWHGANLTFLVWGAFHGVALCVNLSLRRWKTLQLPKIISQLLAFQVVTLGWIIFRSENLQAAGHILLQTLIAYMPSHFPTTNELEAAAYPIFLLGLFFTTHAWDEHEKLKQLLFRLPKSFAGTILVSIWILAFAVSRIGGSASHFIYFDF